RIDEVPVVPEARVLAALAREVGARALRAPLEGVVVRRLVHRRGLAVALRLEIQGADHLRVAEVTTLAHVDVAPLELERPVGARLGGDARVAGGGEDDRDELGDASREDG